MGRLRLWLGSRREALPAVPCTLVPPTLKKHVLSPVIPPPTPPPLSPLRRLVSPPTPPAPSSVPCFHTHPALPPPTPPPPVTCCCCCPPQALLEGISLSQPQPKIPPELIKFLGKSFNAWHVAIPLLESHVIIFPDESRCFDALAELYKQVCVWGGGREGEGGAEVRGGGV